MNCIKNFIKFKKKRKLLEVRLGGFMVHSSHCSVMMVFTIAHFLVGDPPKIELLTGPPSTPSWVLTCTFLIQTSPRWPWQERSGI